MWRLSGLIAALLFPALVLAQSEGGAAPKGISVLPQTILRQDTLAAQNSDGKLQYQTGDADGRAYVNAYGASPDKFYSAVSASDITNTSSTAVATAAGSGVRRYVTSWSCSNTSATSTRMDLLDGSTVIYSSMLPSTGGFHIAFSTPLRGTANTALNVQAATTSTASRCSISGFTSAN